MSDNYFSPSLLADPFILARAKSKARKLACSLNLARENVDDLTQEFLLALCSKIGRFDPDRSPLEAFIALVLKQAHQEAFRRILSERKVAALPLSLKIANADEDDLSLAEIIDADSCFAAMGRIGKSRTETMELRIDVQKALGKLPVSLRRIAEELMDEPRLLASRRGCSRSTIRRAISDIKRIFRANGFGVFYASSRNVSANVSAFWMAKALAPACMCPLAMRPASKPGSRANTRPAREITRPRAPSEASEPGLFLRTTARSERTSHETVCTTA